MDSLDDNVLWLGAENKKADKQYMLETLIEWVLIGKIESTDKVRAYIAFLEK